MLQPAESIRTPRIRALSCFPYDDLQKRDKLSLDITWLRDESLEDTDNLPDPAILAAEIVEDLQAALDQFAQIAADLAKTDSPVPAEASI
jgi:type I restriction enzyme M protein